MKKAFLTKFVALTAGVLACGAVLAQSNSYPNKTVNLVVGYSAGGATDRVARIISKQLT